MSIEIDDDISFMRIVFQDLFHKLRNIVEIVQGIHLKDRDEFSLIGIATVKIIEDRIF